MEVDYMQKVGPTFSSCVLETLKTSSGLLSLRENSLGAFLYWCYISILFMEKGNQL